MKNKKGFTLIEIIICIGMLAVIAVGSFVGIHLVNKNLTIKELNQITNKAVQAAQVYIETNKEAQTQLYTEQNAVKIPIKVLVNEGLLSLKGTKVNEKMIENEYVITALSTGSTTSTECTNIDSKASWDSDHVIYICTNLNNKGEVTGSNLATIDPTKYGNKTTVSNEPYYFKGLYPNNEIVFDDKTQIICDRHEGDKIRKDVSINWRYHIAIRYIDRDDSIVFVLSQNNLYCTNCHYECRVASNDEEVSVTYISNREEPFYKATLDQNKIGVNFYNIKSNWLGSVSSRDGSMNYKYNFEFRLPQKCKIKSGTGADDNPFVVDCS